MFKIELLHLTTVMVHHYPDHLEDFKKDIIKCAWHYITSDDAVVKQTGRGRIYSQRAFLKHSIRHRNSSCERGPAFFGRLTLKAAFSYGKALDILAPALPRSNASEVGYPQWAKTTRRLLAEEGNGFLADHYNLPAHCEAVAAVLPSPWPSLFPTW